MGLREDGCSEATTGARSGLSLGVMLSGSVSDSAGWPAKIVVCHPSPAIRRALIDGLAGVGVEAFEEPSDLVGWLANPPTIDPSEGPTGIAASLDTNHPSGVVLPLYHEAWAELREKRLTEFLFALIDEEDPVMYARAFAKQASGVAATSWEVEWIVRAIQVAIQGFSILSVGVVRAMAETMKGPPRGFALSTTESEALRMLCCGATVVAISEHLSYSEREMHRILGGLYERMGAAHRVEAIVRATAWRLV